MVHLSLAFLLVNPHQTNELLIKDAVHGHCIYSIVNCHLYYFVHKDTDKNTYKRPSAMALRQTRHMVYAFCYRLVGNMQVTLEDQDHWSVI